MADLGNGYFSPAAGTTYSSRPIGTKIYSTNGQTYPVASNQSFNNAPYINPVTVGSSPASRGEVLGASTGGGGSYGDFNKPDLSNQYKIDQYNLAKSQQGNAQSAHDSMLSAIQKRLDETRYQAKQQIDNATGTRDYVTKFINERYPQLIDRAQTAGNRLTEDLTGQATDLTNLYDRAVAQARRRSESAALQNRMNARSGNRLGSSFYDQAVQNNQEELGQNLGNTDREKIGKLAAIGTQKTRIGQDTENTIQDLESQKNQATYSAIDEYKKAVQQSEALSRAGVLDFGEGQAQAEQNLQSRLDSISQWAQTLALQKAQIAGKYDTGGTFDNSLSSLASSNNNFIRGNASTPAATNTANYQSTILGNPQAAASNNFIANQGISKTDDILRQLGLA